MADLITPIMALHDQKELSGLDADEGSTDFLFGLNLNVGSEEEIIYISPFNFENTFGTEQESQEIISLESRIEDLIYLASDIAKSAGMNQAFAMEAEKLLPGFGGVPIGYYSNDTTATRFKVSLEEISKGIWALIAAGIAFVIAIIAKLFGFFSGKKDKGTVKDAEEAIDAVVKDIAEDEKKIKEAEIKIKKADSIFSNVGFYIFDSEGKAFHCASLQIAVDRMLNGELRHSRAKEFLAFTNPIHHDLITFGEYSKAAVMLGERMRSINDVFKLKLDELTSVINENIGSTSNSEELMSLRSLNAINKPIEINVYGKQMTLSEAAGHLRSIRSDVIAKNVRHDIDFDDLFFAMAHVYSGSKITKILADVRSSLSILSSIEKHLIKMEFMMRNLSVDGITGTLTHDIAELVRTTVSTLAKDVSSLKEIHAEISKYADEMRELSVKAFGITCEVMSKLTDEMDRHEYKVPDEWRKVVDSLQMDRQVIKAAFIELRDEYRAKHKK